jgi:hypothetical protein
MLRQSLHMTFSGLNDGVTPLAAAGLVGICTLVWPVLSFVACQPCSLHITVICTCKDYSLSAWALFLFLLCCEVVVHVVLTLTSFLIYICHTQLILKALTSLFLRFELFSIMVWICRFLPPPVW